MNFKRIVFLISAFIVSVFATLVSWYEGGQLRDISWEWKHTAVFSNWINGEVTSSNDILEIDHFVYAAKFEPLFPFLMVISMLFIIFQIAFGLLKDHKIARNIFFLSMAAVSFVLSGMLFNSPTPGLTLFSIFFGIVGLLSLLGVFLFKGKKSKSEVIENM